MKNVSSGKCSDFVAANIYGISEQKWDDIRLVAQTGCGQEDAKSLSDQYRCIVREEDKARIGGLKQEFFPNPGTDLAEQKSSGPVTLDDNRVKAMQ